MCKGQSIAVFRRDRAIVGDYQCLLAIDFNSRCKEGNF